MIEIDGKIISTDILTHRFMCDIARCKGMCCVEGNAGAPLEEEEARTLEREFEAYRPYMRGEGREAVEGQGFAVTDADGDLTTPLVDDLECAYSFDEGGVTLCAVERAWKEGKTAFRKPISCHLYPIRVTRFRNGTLGLAYHRWDVCAPAVACGRERGVPLYKSLKEPIERAFGADFYNALEEAARYLEENPQE